MDLRTTQAFLLSARALSLLSRERDLVCLDAQLFQPLRDLMIDVLEAIVGMKAEDQERKLRHAQPEHRQKECLIDALHTGLDLPRAHGIDTRGR